MVWLLLLYCGYEMGVLNLGGFFTWIINRCFWQWTSVCSVPIIVETWPYQRGDCIIVLLLHIKSCCCFVALSLQHFIILLQCWEKVIYIFFFFPFHLVKKKFQYFRSLLPHPPPPKKNSLGKVNGIILCIDIYPRNFNPIFCLRSKIWLRQCYSNLCFWTDIRIDKRCKFTPIPHAAVYGVVRAWARKTTALPSRQLAYQQAP